MSAHITPCSKYEQPINHLCCQPRIILGMGPANDRMCYSVMPSLISCAHKQNDHWSTCCMSHHIRTDHVISGPDCLFFYLPIFIIVAQLTLRKSWYVWSDLYPGIILCMCPANQGQRYNVTFLIGWVHGQNNPCKRNMTKHGVYAYFWGCTLHIIKIVSF